MPLERTATQTVELREDNYCIETWKRTCKDNKSSWWNATTLQDGLKNLISKNQAVYLEEIEFVIRKYPKTQRFVKMKLMNTS